MEKMIRGYIGNVHRICLHKLRYLKRAVTPNGQSLVYVNVTQNGRLEHVSDYVSSVIVAGERLKILAKTS